jgi:hypothetical protein
LLATKQAPVKSAPPGKRVSRKLQVAVDHLKANPDLKSLSGRELECQYTLEKISYKTWNTAKGKMK